MKVNEKLKSYSIEPNYGTSDGPGRHVQVSASWEFDSLQEAAEFQQALLEFRGPDTVPAKIPSVTEAPRLVPRAAMPDPAGLAPGKDVDDLSTIPGDEPAAKPKRDRRKFQEDAGPRSTAEPAAEKSPAEVAIETDTAAKIAVGGTTKPLVDTLRAAKTFREVMTALENAVPAVALYFAEADEQAKAGHFRVAADAIEKLCDEHRDAVPVIARADKSSLRARIERALQMDDLQRRA